MKSGTSLRVRHIVGRLEKGDELIHTLRQLCARERIRAATFQGIGVLTSVDLQSFDAITKEYKPCFGVENTVELLNLTGNVSTLGKETIINANATIGYSAYGQRHVVGGHLAAAKALVVELQLTVYDDLSIERTYDAATGLPLWNRFGQEQVERPATPEPAAPASSPEVAEEEDLAAVGVHVAKPKSEPTIIRRTLAPKESEEIAAPAKAEPVKKTKKAKKAAPAADKQAWSEAVQKAQQVESFAKLDIPEGKAPKRRSTFIDEDDDLVPEPGDILIHPTLERCRVIRIEDEESVFIRSLKRGVSAKTRKLSLQFFELELVDEEGDNLVYKLTKSRRR